MIIFILFHLFGGFIAANLWKIRFIDSAEVQSDLTLICYLYGWLAVIFWVLASLEYLFIKKNRMNKRKKNNNMFKQTNFTQNDLLVVL